MQILLGQLQEKLFVSKCYSRLKEVRNKGLSTSAVVVISEFTYLDATRVPLECVDVMHAGPGGARGAAVVELADGNVAGVIADEDVARAAVVVEAGAPRRAEVAAQAPPARGAVELEIPAERSEVSISFNQITVLSIAGFNQSRYG